jgi:thiol-disulfide isomerase/thioredoxin
MRLFVTLVFCIFSSYSFAGGIDFFHGTYQEAIAEAKKQEKIIFVDAYTTWCGPCKRMSSQVFTQDAAGEFFNQNFVNIKVDMEKPNGREFGSNYPVSAYPTLLFLDSNGKLIKKSVGGKSLEDFLKLGNDIIEKFDFSVKYRDAYESGDRSYENTIAYVEALNKSNKSSIKIANEFLLENKDINAEQKAAFIFKAASEVDSRIFETLIKNKNAYIAQYGKDVFTEKVMYAAERTRRKAIEFESEDLLNQAIKTVKKHNKGAAKTFAAESYMYKALQEDEREEFIKQSKKYIKTLDSKEAKIDWAKTAMNAYEKDQEILSLAASTLKAPLANSLDKNEITFYTKVLLGLDKKAEALAYVKKLEPLIKDDSTKRQIKSLITYIEKISS